MDRLSLNVRRLAGACLAALALAALHPAAPRTISPDIVISQVYGGGGNTGATFTHDFVELFNRGDVPVSLAGWSIQYASATGTGNLGSTTTQLTDLPAVTLAPGQYYLVQQAGGTIGSPLPTADLIDPTPIAMAAGAGKVALARIPTSLGCNGGSTVCSAAQLADIVDLVGYGSANFFEGAPTSTLSATAAAIRLDAGCTDTDNNSADFTVAPPAPRNTASAVNVCDGPPALSIEDATVTEGNAGTATAAFIVRLNAPAPAGGVSFTLATQDGSATTADGDYVAGTVVGASIPAGEQIYTFAVDVVGDTSVEPNETFLVDLSGVSGAALGRAQATGTITNDDFAPPVFDVVISQVYGGGGNAGAPYTHDFVELFNRGTSAISLAGWSVQYASSAGTTWTAAPLAGTIAPGRYYLVQLAGGATGVALPPADATGGINMSATNGKIALHSTTTPFAGACPAGGTLVDLVGFGITTCFEGAGAAPQPSNTTADLRKRGGCVDSNDNSVDFAIGGPSPRNSASPARSCAYLTAPIHVVQGSGLTSPVAGQDVTTTGVVTGIKSNGFFLQSAAGDEDADAATSQGLFVFTSTAPAVTVGDLAVVKGTATEFFGLTQVEASLTGDVSVTSSGNALPAPVTLTPVILDAGGTITQLERLEGMRVAAPALTSVGPTNEFGEIFTVLSGVARPRREPGIEARYPVPPAAEGGTDCCIPIWDMNPERIMVDTDGLAGSAPLHVTSNVTLSNVTGPLEYSFSNYKVLPELPPAASPSMTAVAAPVPAANEFTVGSFNIENFNHADIQRRKAALHIRTVMQSPDVIGVVEIASLAALQALAAQVNADAVAAAQADPQYQAYLVPFGPNNQHVGFLVKSSRVLVHAVTQELAAQTFVNPVTGAVEALHDRPPLVLEATVAPGSASPARVVVVVNHLRSFIGIELVDGDGLRVRAKRKAQAEAVAQLLDDLQEASPGVFVIAVGDYNAYEFNDGYTDPISVLVGQPTPGDQIVVAGSPDLVDPDFTNLTGTLTPDQRYTFVFEGTPQALDHVLVNAAATRYAQRYTIARSNADFPATLASLAGDASRPELNSDHDSPLAYFAFPGQPVIQLNGGATLTVEAFTPFVDPGATAHDDDGPLPVTVSGTVNVNVPGSYVLTYTAGNAHTSTSVTRTVIVADTIAPAITNFRMSPDTWLVPNHEMFDATASYTATDASGTASCTLDVRSNEAKDGRGDGSTGIDWLVLSPTLVQLRAERSGLNTGRIYTVTVTCVDPSGNSASATATVTIAK